MLIKCKRLRLKYKLILKNELIYKSLHALLLIIGLINHQKYITKIIITIIIITMLHKLI